MNYLLEFSTNKVINLKLIQRNSSERENKRVKREKKRLNFHHFLKKKEYSSRI